MAKIGIEKDEELKPDLETLKRLQKAHLLSIPFENLDALTHKKIVLKR